MFRFTSVCRSPEIDPPFLHQPAADIVQALFIVGTGAELGIEILEEKCRSFLFKHLLRCDTLGLIRTRFTTIVTGKSSVHSSLIRVLVTYAITCFVVLQLLDIMQEPLGLPVVTIRWVVLFMVIIAPLLVIAVALYSRRKLLVSAGVGSDANQELVFRIGHAELDTAQRQIRFGGTPADVQPKVFDLIEYLVRFRDRVVGKDELFDNIWPAVVVTEASLTQSIKRARDLFRQNGFDNDVIRTVSRKGYQFDYAADVADAVSAGRTTMWSDVVLPTAAVSLIAAALGVLVWNSSDHQTYSPITSNAANSLVVLPFANMTADEDFRYFSDGLTETLTSSLTTVRNLRVIARGSAFSFRESQPDYSEIGRELNVAHIVEGSVQRNNNELRISARLIRAQDGHQLWSQIFSRASDDVFAIQDDISRSVVEQMSGLLSTRLELPPGEIGVADPAASAEAYRLLLRGREQRTSASAGKLEAAEKNFRRALRLLPDYPEAMLALADTIRLRAVFGELPRESSFAESLKLIRQTLSQRPDYGDAYLALGEIQHRHFWDFAAAAESYAKALDLSPGSAAAHASYSRFLSKSGKFDQAIEEAEIALDLDPKSAQSASSLAIRLIRARQLDKARAVIDALTMARPNHADLPWLETNWHIRNESYRDALKSIALEELDYLRLSLSAIALSRLNRTDQAREALDTLIESDSEGAAFQIAEVYAQWGEADEAFEWLELAFSQGDPGMAELYSSVNLENLYTDGRFADLAARIGLPPLDSI
jgi:TolB-like protein/DNA-binding winged helix-turn-helix (wHTH) protein/Tfp pilus assembly protein PilF